MRSQGRKQGSQGAVGGRHVGACIFYFVCSLGWILNPNCPVHTLGTSGGAQKTAHNPQITAVLFAQSQIFWVLTHDFWIPGARLAMLHPCTDALAQ